jgi:biopolymer transport protein ExbD
MKKFLAKEVDARSPNFLPLVDVLFVIVAFLVLAANFSERPSSIDISLPSTSYSSSFPNSKNNIEIKLFKSGYVQYQDKRFLLSEFVSAPPQNLSASILALSVDKEVSFDSFIQIYACLSQISSKKVILLVDKEIMSQF